MSGTPTRILLTGPPGCGKTTIILKVVASLARPAAGFYTEEVRDERGTRVGFDVAALSGARGQLARVGLAGPRVGRYGVDLSSFERIGVRALEEGLKNPTAVLVVDELGKMEFSSRVFVELLAAVFNAPNSILGTILARPHPVADRYRRWPGVAVVAVTATNRDTLPQALALRLTRRQ